MKNRKNIFFLFGILPMFGFSLLETPKADLNYSKPDISLTFQKKEQQDLVEIEDNKTKLDDYKIGSTAFFTVDGPGPIVSIKWQFFYEISMIKVINENDSYEIINTYTNDSDNVVTYPGNTSYTLDAPAVTPYMENLDVPGLNTHDLCKEKFAYLTPYGAASKPAAQGRSPSATLNPHTKYTFSIKATTAQFSIYAIQKSCYWSWGSWSDWAIDEQKYTTFKAIFFSTHITTTSIS